ncbi:MAG: YdiU family protein [Candidatus Izimaplasma sp.]|nr:YdiU family protein [Candidatus Izimaplasma bacterium]
MIQEHNYVKLDPKLFSLITPKTYENTELIYFNQDLAKQLNITKLNSIKGQNLLSGSLKEHLYFAQGYAGHQFGHFTILGDGRALNVGEFKNNNIHYEIQLKGSGKTPYSRQGDGKATLYSMLREYLISEALFHLNVPTTRTLSIIKTNEDVLRKKVHKGAISSRVAKSHIRVGTFQYAKVMGDDDLVKELADYTIETLYPKLKDNYIAFFQTVVNAQAKLIAKWQSVGFIHGVLNTDNVLISGEAIDFGPCAFIEKYDLDTVYSSIDQTGRYNYGNQPTITSWNLARLAEVLYPLFNQNKQKAIEKANSILNSFEDTYYNYYYQLMSQKLGFSSQRRKLVDTLLAIMKKNALDYTNTFVKLTTDNLSDLLTIEAFAQWHQKWTKTLDNEKINKETLMKQHNPRIHPRNRIVEQALNNAAFDNDYRLFDEFLDVLKNPYAYKLSINPMFTKSNPDDEHYVTYCGT